LCEQTQLTNNSSALDLLAKLIEHKPSVFSWQRFVDTEHADNFQHLLSIGILRHSSNAGSICCNACDAVHSVRVEFLGGARYRAYCHDVGYYDVDSDHLRVFEPDLAAMTKKIARGLGIPARVPSREIVTEVLYDLGKRKFGPYTTRMCLARRLDRKEEFDRTNAALVQISDRSPALILSTTPWEKTGGTLPSRHAILWLPDVAELDGDVISFEEGAFLAKLRGEDTAFRRGGIGYDFSPGFRSAVVGDQQYEFTKKQAEAVEILFDALKTGRRKVHQDEIKGFLGTNQRIGQLFRGRGHCHPAYGTLIRYDREGYYWLEL
jgi:hypothetical protein